MSTQYDNNLSGALFKNDKEGNAKRPDYRGSCEVNRVEYWVSAWIREPRNGGPKFMSLRFEPKQASQARGGARNPPAQQSQPQRERDDFDDSIPF